MQCLIFKLPTVQANVGFEIQYHKAKQTTKMSYLISIYASLLWFYLPNQMDVPMELQRISLSVNPIEEFLEAPQN